MPDTSLPVRVPEPPPIAIRVASPDAVTLQRVRDALERVL